MSLIQKKTMFQLQLFRFFVKKYEIDDSIEESLQISDHIRTIIRTTSRTTFQLGMR